MARPAAKAPPTSNKSLAGEEPRGDLLAVPVGPRLIELLEIAYRARRPVLLEGATGIGKSQIAAEAAAILGIGYEVLDLSLLEPPDLVGLPVIEGGRTRYASPSELPSTGRGILMLEELNRAEVPVMQPALQLLSARRLHAYELPPGWSCVAAVNPEDGEYQVNRLDPALRARFMQVETVADRATWLTWALRMNVHPTVVRVVQEHPDAFAHASPRSWTYASDILHALTEREQTDGELVRVAVRGYLPAAWAIVLADAVAGQPSLAGFDAPTALAQGGKEALAAFVRQLGARPDALATLCAKLRHVLGGPLLVEAVEDGGLTLASLESLLAPLPGDLREQCLDTAACSPAAVALLRSAGHELGKRFPGTRPRRSETISSHGGRRCASTVCAS